MSVCVFLFYCPVCSTFEIHFSGINAMSGSENSSEEILINSVINTERLIIEIEKRPGIYNKQLTEYSNRDIKEKL